jgi:hypothetical protein
MKKRKREIAESTLEQLGGKAKAGSAPSDTANRFSAPIEQV